MTGRFPRSDASGAEVAVREVEYVFQDQVGVVVMEQFVPAALDRQV